MRYTRASAKVAAPPTDRKPLKNYGNIPLSFAHEKNPGSNEQFVARGKGYGFALTSGGAVISLQGNSISAKNGKTQPRGDIALRLAGARRDSAPEGLEELPGKVNYLLGNDPRKWRTNIDTYGKVVYAQVYPGIDLIYYGNQKTLEYDFRLAPGADPKTIRLRFEGGQHLRVDEDGDLLIDLGDRELRLLKPTAFQEKSGERQTIPSRYQISPNHEVEFAIGDYDRSLPLVIDPVLAYSTYLGGTSDDEAFGIAVDGSGSAYITGFASSTDFPVNSFQTTKGNFSDAFVTKLNPAGTAIVYSTFVGGNNTDRANAIAVDAAGNAYVTGQTFSTDFPLANPLHGTPSGLGDAMVFELNSSGSGLVYSTYLGGSSVDAGNGIAVDQSGNTLVTGRADSRDFPVTNGVAKLGNELFRTTDGAANWNSSDNGLNATTVNIIVYDPTNANVVYAATDNAIFKSFDGGANWSRLNSQTGLTGSLAVNPLNSSIIYAAATAGVFKSTDSGTNFAAVSLSPQAYSAVIVDPINPARVYAASGSSVFISTDSGATWTTVNVASGITVNGLAIDPTTPANVYAATNRGVFKSGNSGNSWTAVNAGINFETGRALAIDKNNPATIYFGSNTGIFKTTTSGSSWTKINNNIGSSVSVTNIVIDPANSTSVYVIASTTTPIFKTVDGGSNWNTVTNGYSSNVATALAISPSSSSTLLVGTSAGTDAFVTKLAPGGSTQIYSTYLGGSSSDVTNAIAVDAAGRAYVTGSSVSTDFPVMNAVQATKGDTFFLTDAFLTIFNANGTMAYSTYLGSDGSDAGRGVAVDAGNNIYIAGTTTSTTFPGPNGPVPTIGGGGSSDAFVTKLNANGSGIIYSTIIGGGSNDVCNGIALDSTGAAHLVGTTSSADFPVAGAPQPIKGAGNDAFVTKLTPAGAVSYSTFLGGSSNDNGQAIAVDTVGSDYVTGFTASPNFPTVNPIRNTFGGVNDVFVSKLGIAPDLVVTMTGGTGPINFGSPLTYNITVANNGEVAAAGVQLVDTLLSGAGVVSINTNRGSCSGNRIVNCDLGTLNPGESAAITLVAMPPAITPMTNTATASSTSPDSNTANNTAAINTQVNFTDVMLKNTSALQVTEVGGVNNYIVTVTNKGPAAATTIVVTDNLPAQLSFVNCATTAGTCGGSGNSPTVTVNSLAVGASFTATIGARVNSGITPGTVISNTASMTSVIPDINPNNDAQTALTTVKAASGLGNLNGVIAFSSNAGSQTSGTSDIYIINPDGTGLRDITFDNILGDTFPAWSNDGSKIVFTGTGGGADSGLWVMNADGTGKTQLTIPNNSNNDTNACWSPDGTRILFNGTRPNLTGLLMINADGTQLKSLGISGGSPAWSPDGTRIAFGDGIGLQIAFADGGGKTKIVSGFGGMPSWSPDSARLVYSQPDSTSAGSSLYIVNADGTGNAQISNSNGGQFPSWSPDGTKIAFSSGGFPGGLAQGVYTINVDGTGLTKISGNLPSAIYPRWQRRPLNSSPLSPTFNISGHITNAANGSAVSTQAISITGGQTRTVQTNQNGDYIFWGVPSGDYTVAPQFDPIFSAGATSNPANRVFNNLSADQAGVDFAITFGTRPPLTGFVKDANGNPLTGVRVALRNSVTDVNAFTDSTGFYTFGTAFVGPIAFAIVVPQDSYSNYVFNPPIIQNLTQHFANNNFNGYPMTASLSGKVSVGGVGKSGIVVFTGQPQPMSTTTDANGNYSFSSIGNGLPLQVSVDTSTYPFSPSPQTVTVTGQQTGVNFDAPANQFLISGQITAVGSANVENVTVTLSGASNATVQTDAGGNYSFGLLPAGGAYTVVPAKTGYTFSPSSTNIASLNSNTRANFSATLNTLQFFTDSINVAALETDGKVTLTIVRFGTLAQTVKVDYATGDGTASQRTDYTATSGTLTFGPQEQSKTIVIPFNDDSYAEGDETFTVTLSNPSGALLGNAAVCVVTIQDDDTADPTLNPLDQAPFYTRQQYLDFLSRVPDTSGLNFWTQNITDCGLDKACEEVHRINVSGAFFLSIEFQQTGYLVERIYKTAYGDGSASSTIGSPHQLPVPIVRLNEFLPDTQAIGQGVVVLAPGWEQALETNKQNFVNAFVQRGRFIADYPANMTAADFVDKLNSRAGSPLSPAERNQLVSDLSSNARTRAQVLRAIAEHQNLVNAEVNRAFVLMQYFGYLRRNPNDAPDSDYTGFDFWLTKLNQFNGDYLAAEMVKAFISSSEYRKRFGP